MEEKKRKEMKNRKILHIDDEGIFRDECSQIFKGTGLKLDFAANSIEGLEKIQNKRYDLVLLDIIMPDLNNKRNENAGLELLAKIKEKEVRIPVIMISVVEHMSKAIEALKLGAVDYITKDKIMSQELIQKVMNAFGPVEQPMDSITYLIRQGESTTLEFKSSLRWNFKSNRNDKQIQYAWLKTLVGFLNTEGGILLVGIDDNRYILGLEHDNFPNNDKLLLHFTNMVRRHIGLEFSKYLKFDVKLVQNKKILFVECKKSPDPAYFLLNDEEEDFYIRVGPSTRKLSTKGALKYLENRRR